MSIQILIWATACGAITSYAVTKILIGKLVGKLESLEVEHRKALFEIAEKFISTLE